MKGIIMLEHVFGFLTMAFACGMVLWGLPAQIHKNRAEKHCGVALPVILLMLAISSSRIAYSLTLGAFYLIIPDSLGLLLFLIIYRQYLRYR